LPRRHHSDNGGSYQKQQDDRGDPMPKFH
jgi:hypothetical protein